MESAEAAVGSKQETFELDNFVSKKYGISFIAYVKVGLLHACLFLILSSVFQKNMVAVVGY